MGEKFAYIYRGGSDVADSGCAGLAQWPYLLQYDLSGRYSVGAFVPGFSVSAGNRPE